MTAGMLTGILRVDIAPLAHLTCVVALSKIKMWVLLG